MQSASETFFRDANLLKQHVRYCDWIGHARLLVGVPSTSIKMYKIPRRVGSPHGLPGPCMVPRSTYTHHVYVCNSDTNLMSFNYYVI